MSLLSGDSTIEPRDFIGIQSGIGGRGRKALNYFAASGESSARAVAIPLICDSFAYFGETYGDITLPPCICRIGFDEALSDGEALFLGLQRVRQLACNHQLVANPLVSLT